MRYFTVYLFYNFTVLSCDHFRGSCIPPGTYGNFVSRIPFRLEDFCKISDDVYVQVELRSISTLVVDPLFSLDC